MKAIAEKLTGPTTSIVLHLLIILAAYNFIRFVVNPPQEEQIEITFLENTQQVDLDPFEQELDELKPIEEFADNKLMNEPPAENDAPLVEHPVDDQHQLMPVLSPVVILDIKGITMIPDVFSTRSGPGREQAMKENGSDKDTEQAVVKALEWLKKTQLKEGPHEGAWGPDFHSAMAGLGLLTFLAHGEAPASERYGETVENAIQYLVKSQDLKTGMWKGAPHDYGHAIATYAIAEAYAMTKIPSLRPVMEKGIKVIVDGIGTKPVARQGSIRPVKGLDRGGQTTAGLWNYHYDNKGGRWDTSYAGWQAQALKAAKLAGSSNPKLAQTLELAKNGFKYMHKPKGGFGYSSPGSTPNMTGVGVLCLQLLGEGKSSEVKEGLGVLENLPRYAYPLPVAGEQGQKGVHARSTGSPVAKNNFYFVYYASQARFHAGGSSWNKWNKEFAAELVKNQNLDGSWSSTGEHGPELTYPTTLGALTLMVYYRNLHTSKEGAVKAAPPPPEADDIKLEII